MRNLKRFLAMALTVLMVVGSFSAMSVSAFDDVTDYQEAIDVMAALGILCGTEEDKFEPDENIARWQMALIITKMMTGKIDAAYVEANFNTTLNSTVYTDLNEGQYMGATAYAANNGIVVGTSATTFEPEESIMIQDVFTMVVRMLGYGSTAMNANYPWSFIDKAISLDLDAGLPADYANEKAATRGETAQILYNALTAVKADGSTLGYDFFGLEKATVIITGTKDGNMFNSKAAVVTKTVDGVDQVAFAVLNADGTIGAETYYAPKTAFGIEGNANAYVGYPYVVRTVDAFKTFMTVEPIEAVVLDQDAVVGATADAGKGKITLDGQEYVLAEAYSDFIKDNSVEIILNQVGTYANTLDYGSYVMDKDLNIMGKDGNVLLWWVTTYGTTGVNYANLNGTYLYKVAEGKYIVPNDAIWAQAATYTTGTEAYGFKAIMDSKALEAKDAYSDTVVFDLDGDGLYDRGIYTNYSLTKIADGKNIDTATTTSALTFVTADGETKAFADFNGKYVLYAYNDLYNTVIIKTAFETNTALVTGADLAANKITFNGFGLDFFAPVVGETYAYGNAKLPGAVVITDATGAYFAEIIGKNAVYIEDNGVVLAIEQFASAAEYMVITDVNTGYTTMGYPQIMGYTSTAAVKDIITINAVNNYWYAQIDAKVYTEGTLVALTKDALGYYDVKVKADNYTAADDAKIVIKNGIVSAENIANFPTFAATADLVWIVRNAANKYETYIGIPASGAYVDVDAASIFYDKDAKFIYVNGGKFAGNAAGGNAWGYAPVESTIVYIDAAALATRVETNVIGNVNIFGTVSSYSNAIDMINGGYVSVTYTDYNFNRLTTGFYKVEGGRIVGEADDLVGTALLADADRLTKWTYSWIPEYDAKATYYTGDLKTVNSVLPTLYLEGKGVTDQLLKTSAGEFTDAYKALNDDTADGKNDALVVYYAKAMFADSKPIFLAKDITVDATLAAKPGPAATYAVIFEGVETAITLTNGAATFKFDNDDFTVSADALEWALVNKDGEFVEFKEIGYGKYAVAVTESMFTADATVANKYVLVLNIDEVVPAPVEIPVTFKAIYAPAIEVEGKVVGENAYDTTTYVWNGESGIDITIADGYRLRGFDADNEFMDQIPLFVFYKKTEQDCNCFDEIIEYVLAMVEGNEYVDADEVEAMLKDICNHYGYITPRNGEYMNDILTFASRAFGRHFLLNITDRLATADGNYEFIILALVEKEYTVTVNNVELSVNGRENEVYVTDEGPEYGHYDILTEEDNKFEGTLNVMTNVMTEGKDVYISVFDTAIPYGEDGKALTKISSDSGKTMYKVKVTAADTDVVITLKEAVTPVIEVTNKSGKVFNVFTFDGFLVDDYTGTDPDYKYEFAVIAKEDIETLDGKYVIRVEDTDTDDLVVKCNNETVDGANGPDVEYYTVYDVDFDEETGKAVVVINNATGTP